MNEDELKAKVREFFELLVYEDEPRGRALAIALLAREHRSRIEKQVRDFYSEYGRWPVFQRSSTGIGIQIECVKKAGSWPNERNVGQQNPPQPAISEEARRVAREDKELRAALRGALCEMDPARRKERAKSRGMTEEELTEKMVDNLVQMGWGEGFRLYHAKNGRYPNDTELTDVAWGISERTVNENRL